ncbi:MAG: hypothetical protein C0619_10940 [Desulfuromonas sp.]|nr:MAG: hypothetical protein C0619_10940 [Desulfuromonas sp.]
MMVNLLTWGDEQYGSVPEAIEPESPQAEFEIGDIAYWLQGSGFCILYGRTPVSTNENPRLITPGNYLA